MQLPTKTLLALLPFFLRANAGGASGTGTTTRYWDCCKTTCAWSGKATLASGSGPVTTCDINDNRRQRRIRAATATQHTNALPNHHGLLPMTSHMVTRQLILRGDRRPACAVPVMN